MIVVSTNFPSAREPAKGQFVRSFALEAQRVAGCVTVIAPRTVFSLFRNSPDRDYSDFDSTERLDVKRPLFVSASAFRISSRLSTQRLSQLMLTRAVTHSGRRAGEPKLIYAHFLSNAFAAIPLARYFGCPLIAGVGESGDYLRQLERHLGLSWMRHQAKQIHKFACVSDYLRDYVRDELFVPADRVHSVPNVPNTEVFYREDRASMRRLLNLPHDAFIVSYVGAFTERKGFARVLQAVETIPDCYCVMLGAGRPPNHERLLFAGAVQADMVRKYLNASDVFSLPTKNEGYSNAINEAIACGIPIVSSNIPEVAQQVDPEFSVLVPPDDISALADAIRGLRDDANARVRMQSAALRCAQRFSYGDRVRAIIALARTGE